MYQAVLEAFARSLMAAHAVLMKRRIRLNYSVEELPYFMAALPAEVSTQLRMAEPDHNLTLLLGKARMLVNIQQTDHMDFVGGIGGSMDREKPQ